MAGGLKFSAPHEPQLRHLITHTQKRTCRHTPRPCQRSGSLPRAPVTRRTRMRRVRAPASIRLRPACVRACMARWVGVHVCVCVCVRVRVRVSAPPSRAPAQLSPPPLLPAAAVSSFLPWVQTGPAAGKVSKSRRHGVRTRRVRLSLRPRFKPFPFLVARERRCRSERETPLLAPPAVRAAALAPGARRKDGARTRSRRRPKARRSRCPHAISHQTRARTRAVQCGSRTHPSVRLLLMMTRRSHHCEGVVCPPTSAPYPGASGPGSDSHLQMLDFVRCL